MYLVDKMLHTSYFNFNVFQLVQKFKRRKKRSFPFNGAKTSNEDEKKSKSTEQTETFIDHGEKGDLQKKSSLKTNKTECKNEQKINWTFNQQKPVACRSRSAEKDEKITGNTDLKVVESEKAQATVALPQNSSTHYNLANYQKLLYSNYFPSYPCMGLPANNMLPQNYRFLYGNLTNINVPPPIMQPNSFAPQYSNGPVYNSYANHNNIKNFGKTESFNRPNARDTSYIKRPHRSPKNMNNGSNFKRTKPLNYRRPEPYKRSYTTKERINRNLHYSPFPRMNKSTVSSRDSSRNERVRVDYRYNFHSERNNFRKRTYDKPTERRQNDEARNVRNRRDSYNVKYKHNIASHFGHAKKIGHERPFDDKRNISTSRHGKREFYYYRKSPFRKSPYRKSPYRKIPFRSRLPDQQGKRILSSSSKNKYQKESYPSHCQKKDDRNLKVTVKQTRQFEQQSKRVVRCVIKKENVIKMDERQQDILRRSRNCHNSSKYSRHHGSKSSYNKHGHDDDRRLKSVVIDNARS